jgi:hypothetical protein
MVLQDVLYIDERLLEKQRKKCLSNADALFSVFFETPDRGAIGVEP